MNSDTPPPARILGYETRERILPIGQARSGCGIARGFSNHFCDTSWNPPLYEQNSLWEALSVVSQKWPPQPIGLDSACFTHVQRTTDDRPLVTMLALEPQGSCVLLGLSSADLGMGSPLDRVHFFFIRIANGSKQATCCPADSGMSFFGDPKMDIGFPGWFPFKPTAKRVPTPKRRATSIWV